MDSYIPYKQIPDDYNMLSIFCDKPYHYDYNSIFVFKKLYDDGYLKNGTAREDNGKIYIDNEHIYTGSEYSESLYSYLSKEYLESAKLLAEQVLLERKMTEETGEYFLSQYANPCAFLCRHAIELKLKQCLSKQANPVTNSHKILDLWGKVDKSKLDSVTITKLEFFLAEVSTIDPNGENIRYGTGRDSLPINQSINSYDCVLLVQNTMYLFNQLHIIAF